MMGTVQTRSNMRKRGANLTRLSTTLSDFAKALIPVLQRNSVIVSLNQSFGGDYLSNI